MVMIKRTHHGERRAKSRYMRTHLNALSATCCSWLLVRMSACTWHPARLSASRTAVFDPTTSSWLMLPSGKSGTKAASWKCETTADEHKCIKGLSRGRLPFMWMVFRKGFPLSIFFGWRPLTVVFAVVAAVRRDAKTWLREMFSKAF